MIYQRIAGLAMQALNVVDVVQVVQSNRLHRLTIGIAKPIHRLSQQLTRRHPAVRRALWIAACVCHAQVARLGQCRYPGCDRERCTCDNPAKGSEYGGCCGHDMELGDWQKYGQVPNGD